MPKFHQIYTSKHSVNSLYELVADVESYADFLPWCSASRVVDDAGEYVIADLVISFKAFTEHYRSRVDFVPPSNAMPSEIKVSLVSGPFKFLVNNWKFLEVNGETNIDFYIDFEFKSKMLEALIGGLFEKACHKMVKAFEQRADELYGKFD